MLARQDGGKPGLSWERVKVRAACIAADAAWAASDTLHVAAAILGSRTLRQAADDYDRAAREPYGRIPQPTPPGNQLRQAAWLLSTFVSLTGDRTLAPVVLITRLAALAEAVAELRDAQQHAAQAAAALRAAERLYALPGRHRLHGSRHKGHPPPAQLAATLFPGPPVPPGSRQPAPGQVPSPAPRRPPQPWPRGPTR